MAIAPITQGLLRLRKSEETAMLIYKFDPSDFHPTLKTRLLILQPSPFCNINCAYCYLPNRNVKARMSLDTVRSAAERLLTDGLVGETLTVVWHAGEPLVVPSDFYESAIGIIQKILGSACNVSHSIQTNATLINDAWCKLFRRHNIRVGVSVDGPAELHDRHRRTRTGSGTHYLVVRGMELLRAHGIPFHAIAVVTDATFDRVDTFFDFFLDHQVQEVGCNFDEAEGTHDHSSLVGNEEAHATFVSRLLDHSIASEGRVRVRELANAFQLIAGDPPTYRWRGHTWPANAQVMPFALLTVGWNGDFCTFSPELLGQPSQEFGNFILGNVERHGFFASAQSRRFTRLWSAIIHGTQTCEQNCTYFNFCGGGAPINKLYENGTFVSAETLYCRTMLQRPFDTILERLERDQRQNPANLRTHF
jgi:uncharacterized protein